MLFTALLNVDEDVAAYDRRAIASGQTKKLSDNDAESQ